MASRYGLKVFLVSADELGAPFEPWLTKVVVGGVGTVAEAIRAEAHAVDVVITDDVALAGSLIGQVARLLTSKGQHWTEAGPTPKIMESVRKSTRARFESVLEDELRSMLSHR